MVSLHISCWVGLKLLRCLFTVGGKISVGVRKMGSNAEVDVDMRYDVHIHSQKKIKFVSQFIPVRISIDIATPARHISYISSRGKCTPN